MRKVKWGVLGTAYIFERDTAEGMKQAENCELYAIAGRSMEKAEGFREKYGFQKAYGSYEALLADDEVEAVYIQLPNTMHYEWTLKALRAKNMYSVKSRSRRQCRKRRRCIGRRRKTGFI